MDTGKREQPGDHYYYNLSPLGKVLNFRIELTAKVQWGWDVARRRDDFWPRVMEKHWPLSQPFKNRWIEMDGVGGETHFR